MNCENHSNLPQDIGVSRPEGRFEVVSEVTSVVMSGARFRGGFSLIELLVVVGILAILGGVVVVAFTGVEAGANDGIATAEMQQIKRSVLRFYRDTGYLPKQGPFGRSHVDAEAAGGSEAWFDSPANFDQLLNNPLDGTGHALEDYDLSARRGWNGPYIADGQRGFVDIGEGVDPSDGSGSPSSGAVVAGVPRIGDPYLRRPDGVYFVTRVNLGDDPLDRAGRPYLLLGLDNGVDEARDAFAPRIVGFGPDGVYGTDDDVTLFLFR